MCPATDFLCLDANTLFIREIACVGYIRRSKLVPRMAETVAAFIKRKRKDRELTQAQLGQLAGLSRGTIIEIEKGESEHGYSTIESVIIALGATMDELRASTKDTPPNHPP